MRAVFGPAVTKNSGDEPQKDDEALTRKDVLRWATAHGSIPTLRKVDEAESLRPFLSSMTFLTTRTEAAMGEQPLPLLLLHLASLAGHTDVVRFFLELGADVNATVAGFLLPIHFAKTADVVSTLLSHGSRIDNTGGYTPLFFSLSWGADSSAARAFLDLGIDPNYINPFGLTASVAAIEAGNPDALQLLLEAGAEVNNTLVRGEHLIYYAIWSASRFSYNNVPIRMVRMLLDYGADANAGYKSLVSQEQNVECYTPYLLLAAMMSDTADIFELLLDRGADVHAYYTRSRRLLDSNASRLEGFQEVLQDNLFANLIAATVYGPAPYHGHALVPADTIRKLKAMLQHGFSIESPVEGSTPLHFCLRQNGGRAQVAMDLIPHLVDLGADVDIPDKDGNRPLHVLTAHLYKEIQQRWMESRSFFCMRFLHPSPLTRLMDVLIDHGADPNAMDADGRTPLMHLCRQPSKTPTALLMKALLSRQGIDANIADKSGCTALHYAAGASGTLHTPEACFRLQILLNYSRGDININPVDSRGRTPLHVLITAQTPKDNRSNQDHVWRQYMMKRRALVMLLRAGADTTTRVDASSQPTAVRNTNQESEEDSLSEIFASNGAQVPASETLGDTVLHLACQSQQPAAMLEVLLRHGADVHVNSVSGHLGLTPLMIVVSLASGQKLARPSMAKAVQLLLSAGADAQLRDSMGRTAWDLSMLINKSSLPWIWATWVEDLIDDRKKRLSFVAENLKEPQQGQANLTQ
ncbi:Chain A, Monoextended DARPin R12 [Paramyrothecium foliicola]|nr:Chain A, Monoextended DARPin R12 [Paramyrothecium foliicola]